MRSSSVRGLLRLVFDTGALRMLSSQGSYANGCARRAAGHDGRAAPFHPERGRGRPSQWLRASCRTAHVVKYDTGGNSSGSQKPRVKFRSHDERQRSSRLNRCICDSELLDGCARPLERSARPLDRSARPLDRSFQPLVWSSRPLV